VTTFEYASARLTTWRVRVRLVPLLLSILALPFVAIGWTGGISVVGYRAAVLAVRTGYADVRSRYPRAD
jgi:hypothetical protein